MQTAGALSLRCCSLLPLCCCRPITQTRSLLRAELMLISSYSGCRVPVRCQPRSKLELGSIRSATSEIEWDARWIERYGLKGMY